MTCCTSEIRCVIPAEAGIQNAVPALIEKLRKNPTKTSCGQAADVHVGIMEHKVTLDNAVNEFIAE